MTARSVNKNVSSSKLKLSADNLKELQKLYIVHRFQKSHGNKKAQAWNYFGFLYYDDTDTRRQHDGGQDKADSDIMQRAPLLHSKQLESDTVRCALCLRREQKCYRDSNGRAGHLSSIKQYSLTTSSSALNKHLKDEHDVTIADSTEDGNKQSLITQYTTGIRQLQPATSPYELNRDLVIWSSLDLEPFCFVEGEGMNFFSIRIFQP